MVPVILFTSLLWIPNIVYSASRADRTERVRKAAAVVYTGQYKVACNRALVQKALDHPVVMGALWAAYGYAPAYRMTALDEPDAMHVVDPTGIIGDVWPVTAENSRRVFLTEGRLNHWAVPALNEGAAVFEVELATRGSGVEVTVTIYLAPRSTIAGAAMWALSPIVKAHIENRISLNFQDGARILEEIARTPQSVSERLQGPVRKKFERIFRDP